MSDIIITSEKKTINENENQNTLRVKAEYSEVDNLIVNNDSNFNNLSIISNLTLNGNANIKIKNYDINENSIPQNVYNPFVPCGTILSFATKLPPNGWLSCDGRYLPKIEQFLNLYKIIGDTWDDSDVTNESMFKLPNLNNGSFIRGGNVDGITNEFTTRKPINNFDMSLNGTTSSDGNHSHGLHLRWNGAGIKKYYPNRNEAHSNATRYPLYGMDYGGVHAHSFPTIIINSSSIENWDNETLPIHVKLLYCIKY